MALASSILLLAALASPGTGLIAGAPVRAVLEQAGYTDVLTKCTGSTNTMNVVYATRDALSMLKDALAVARKRGIRVKDLFS